MDADGETAVERAGTVLEESLALHSEGGLEVGVVLTGRNGGALQEGDDLVEEARVAGDLEVVGDHVGKPDRVIGDPGPNALAGRWMPPVLDVSLHELARGRPEQVRPSDVALGDDEGHHVLELVTKPVGASRLIEGRARPESAAERLIEQPAVQHEIHGTVGRRDPDSPEDVVPVGTHGLQDHVEVRLTIPAHQLARFRGGRRLAQEEHEVLVATGRDVDHRLKGRAWIEARADPPRGSGRPPLQQRGMIRSSVAPEDLGPVARPAGLTSPEIGEGDPPAEVNVPGVTGEERSRLGIDVGGDERRGRASRGAQRPLDIGGDREASGRVRVVLQSKAGDLDRVRERNELEKVRGDAVGRVLEPAVALAMPGDVRGGVLADGEQSGPPQRAGVLVADVDGFRARVADRVVGPGGQLILPTVDRPGISRARFRDLESKPRVGDDVDPGGGGPLSLPEDGDVFTPVIDEAPEAVEELPVGARERHARGRGRFCRTPSRRGDGAGRLGARELLRERSVSTQEDGSGRQLERGMIFRREQILPDDEDVAVCALLLVSSRRLARPEKRLQGGLELLGIGVRLLVHDDEVDGQPLHAPVLVRAEELPDDPAILRLVDADQDDRNLAGDLLGPQGRWPGGLPAQCVRRGPQGGVGVDHSAGQVLEEMRLLRLDPEVVALDLRLRPGQRDGAVEGRRIPILVGEGHRGFA